MPLDPQLIELMIDTVTIEPKTGIDKFNNIQYGDAVTVQCQIERMNKRVLDRTGRELISTVGIILATPELSVGAEDRVTLPDGSQPAIMEVLAVKDEVGPYYLELRT